MPHGDETMSVKIVGPFCSRCQERPASYKGLCGPCDRLTRAFGQPNPDPLEELWNLESKEEGEA